MIDPPNDQVETPPPAPPPIPEPTPMIDFLLWALENAERPPDATLH